MRAVLYVRVSTDGQERDGTSLDTQEQACTKYAESQGWEIVARVHDTASGFSLERPGIDRVRRYMRDGLVDVVVAYAVDRLSRNQSHIGILVDEADRYGAKLDFVTEDFEQTAVGKFILSARAFVAEMEREKIVERTTRGKTARAKSGRLPQANGRGLYGYRYNRETGKREVDEYQASVVRRVFERYAETRSLSGVSSELNDAGIPAFTGGRWYPLTIRNLLLRDSYTGRTVYRRTKRVRTRNAKAKTMVLQRPEDEWIEIDGATPRIIDQQLWQRVQDILEDPERIRRKPEGRYYALGSRVRCGMCGAAMVGQTLTNRGRSYRYYRCRHAYDKNSGHDCSARYVSADTLDTAVKNEVIRVLGNPELVLAEMKAAEASSDTGEDDLAHLERELASLDKSEKRLLKLFMVDDLSEDALREEAANLKRQKQAIEAQLQTRRRTRSDGAEHVDIARLRLIAQHIETWLENAGAEEWSQVLEALQITVEATRERATIRGILPAEVPKFITIEQTSACSQSGA